MKEFRGQKYDGERALFGTHGALIDGCTFVEGESPVKECSDIEITNSRFVGKYPIWYDKNIRVKDSTLETGARAGLWYVDELKIDNTVIEAPKTIRRCSNISLTDVNFTEGPETLWHNNGVKLKNVTAKGDYFAMNCENMEIDGLDLVGNYSFDGVKNVTIKNSRIIGRDAFWNSEDITLENCVLSGNYLAWNTKNISFTNCRVESLQGLCYIENLVMKNCDLTGTTLAFEYSSLDAQISEIDSIINPASGSIRAEKIGNLILEKEIVDTAKTEIDCPAIGKLLDNPEWKE